MAKYCELGMVCEYEGEIGCEGEEALSALLAWYEGERDLRAKGDDKLLAVCELGTCGMDIECETGERWWPDGEAAASELTQPPSSPSPMIHWLWWLRPLPPRPYPPPRPWPPPRPNVSKVRLACNLADACG